MEQYKVYTNEPNYRFKYDCYYEEDLLYHIIEKAQWASAITNGEKDIQVRYYDIRGLKNKIEKCGFKTVFDSTVPVNHIVIKDDAISITLCLK